MKKKKAIKAIPSPKRDLLVKTARDLFFKHGSKRVTIDEICRTADVSKMTFYKYFHDKVDLVKTLFLQLIDEKMTGYQTVMSLDIPYTEKMERIVKLRIAFARDIGREFILDLASSPSPEIREFLHRKTDEMFKVVINDYLKAQKEGHIRADIKPQFLSWIVGHLTDSFSDQNLVGQYASIEDLTSEIINFFLYGIMTRKG